MPENEPLTPPLGEPKPPEGDPDSLESEPVIPAEPKDPIEV